MKEADLKVAHPVLLVQDGALIGEDKNTGQHLGKDVVVSSF